MAGNTQQSQGKQMIIVPPGDDLAKYNVDEAGWRLLVDTLYPTATSADQVLAILEFCRVRKYDPFRRPVHLVVKKPTRKNPKETFEIWPGINSIMSDAANSGKWAGIDKPEMGPMTELTFTDQWEDYNGNRQSRTFTLKVPEYCVITVYRRAPDGSREGYAIPVYWTEACATVSQYSDVPNSMWQKRPIGMLQKCALAASLRAAFPEISDYAAEEMPGYDDGGAVYDAEPVRGTTQPTQATAATPGPAERFKAAAGGNGSGNGRASLTHEQTKGMTAEDLAAKPKDLATTQPTQVADRPAGNGLAFSSMQINGRDIDPETGEVLGPRPNGSNERPPQQAKPPGPIPIPPNEMASPLHVPVPVNAKGGVAWAEWLDVFRSRIQDGPPTEAHFKELNAANMTTLNVLREKKQEAVMRLWDEQADAIAQAAMREDKPGPIEDDGPPDTGPVGGPQVPFNPDEDDPIPF